VLDLATIYAGPLAAMMLGDFGAEVVKVEHPRGDPMRTHGESKDGHGLWWKVVSRNKLAITLNLSMAQGQEVLKQLATETDVLVENFRPGVMDKLGLGWAQLSAANPGLVYCSVTGFGAGEVGATMPGYDLLIQALGGLMSITGPADGEPSKVGVALVDVLAGLFAAVGILAALRHRDATGAGQRVEVDLYSALLAALVNQGSAYTVAGVVPGRMGNRHPSIALYELFKTGAGELVVAVGNDRQFAALGKVLGEPALAADPDFATNSARVENRDALGARLEVLLAARPATEWAELLNAVRVPAGVVNDVGAAFRLAEAIGLDPTVTIPRGDGTEVSLTRNPIRLSATPPTYRTPPPPAPAD
jgi:crotonobetainyl-CoA:carnitine CoA-transferase CaiB-like acyl-CoA transferase